MFDAFICFWDFSIQSDFHHQGLRYHIFLSSRNAQLRHTEFEGYLHHCVKQYSLYGHGSLTSSLCSWADWNAWSKAVAGEAMVGVKC